MKCLTKSAEDRQRNNKWKGSMNDEHNDSDSLRERRPSDRIGSGTVGGSGSENRLQGLVSENVRVWIFRRSRFQPAQF